MSEFVFLQGGMVVPRPALDALLDLERAGHRLLLDGDDIIVEPARGISIDPAQLASLRRWKPHIRMLMTYTPDDSHLRADADVPDTSAHARRTA